MADPPGLAPPFATTLAALLAARAAADPDRVLLLHDDAEITVGRLAADAARRAAAHRARGVAPGMPVATMLEAGPGHVAEVLGLALAGALWVPLAPDARGPALAHALERTAPRLALAAPGGAATLRAAGLAPGVPVVEVDGAAPLGGDGGAPPPLLDAPEEPDAPRAILFTSGTTGPPKGVIVTERMLAASAAGSALASACAPGDTFLMWEPMHHIGGPQLLMMALAHGARLVLVPRFSASGFWPAVRRHGVTRLHYLGGILEILLAAPPAADDRDHPIRLAFGGGCRAEVGRAFTDRFGVPIREVYGMTEASSFTTVDRRGVPGSCGQPVPWFDVALAGEAAGRGEIVVRPRHPGLLTPGYLGDPAATARLLQADGLHTGDLGARDAAGNWRFLGRVTDSLRRRGENVSAWEVETALAAHPEIAEAAVVGVPAEIGEHEILCFVALRAGAGFDPEALARWCRAEMPRHHVPRYWKQVAAFERTPSQRIRKDRLDRTLADAADTAAPRP